MRSRAHVPHSPLLTSHSITSERQWRADADTRTQTHKRFTQQREQANTQADQQKINGQNGSGVFARSARQQHTNVPNAEAILQMYTHFCARDRFSICRPPRPRSAIVCMSHTSTHARAHTRESTRRGRFMAPSKAVEYNAIAYSPFFFEARACVPGLCTATAVRICYIARSRR